MLILGKNNTRRNTNNVSSRTSGKRPMSLASRLSNAQRCPKTHLAPRKFLRSREPQAVGAVYDRPGFFVQSPKTERTINFGGNDEKATLAVMECGAHITNGPERP